VAARSVEVAQLELYDEEESTAARRRLRAAE
jgi:hypothetical protein